MSTSLSAIQNNYIRNFPAEVPIKAAQGFIVTAAINLIAGRAGNVALFGGAIAATSTMIEAVTRPIIRSIFQDHRTIAIFIQIFFPKMIALGLAASIAPWIGVSYKMNSFLLPLIAWIALNHDFFNRNVGMAEML